MSNHPTPNKFDWRWMRSLSVVAQYGALTSAASNTDISQPTLSRHLRQLEDFYGAPLLRYDGNKVNLTVLGNAVLTHAKEMQQAAQNAADVQVALARGGRATRISVSPAFASHILPKAIRDMPDALGALEIVVETTHADLLKGDAQIAIRLAKPRHADLTVRKIGNLTYGIYGHRSILGDRPALQSASALLEQVDIVGFAVPGIEEKMAAAHFDLSIDMFRYRSDDPSWRTVAVCAGLGIGVIPEIVGEANDDLTRLQDQSVPIEQDVWLAAASQALQDKRVEHVFEFLADRLSRQMAGSKYEP